MTTDTAPVLVTGATGRQGGATARALLASGVPVRALVRDPATDRAKAVEALGADLVTGDLHDRDSVTRAAEGARAVFSVQMPAFNGDAFDFDGEVTQAVNLIDGALAAGVPQFVHTSVSGAGQHTEIPGWAEGRWASMLPAMAFLFPRGVEGGLVSVLKPGTRLSVVAVHDIGQAAAAAIAAPDRFDGVELELAGDYLTMTDIAAILSRALGTELTAPDMTVEEATAAGMPGMGASHEFMNVAGQPARPEFGRAFGIPLTTFEEWTRQHLGSAQ